MWLGWGFDKIKKERIIPYLCDSPVLQGPTDSNEPLHGDGQGDVDGDTEGHSRHRVQQVDVQLRDEKKLYRDFLRFIFTNFRQKR